MARKSASGSGAIGILLLGLVGLIASIPTEVWICIGVAAGLYLLARLLSGKKGKANPAVSQVPDLPADVPRAQASVMPGELVQRPQKPVQKARSSGFRIPNPPKDLGPARWYLPGQEVQVAGRRIVGGLIYVGSSLPTSTSGSDPSLIDPSKATDSRGDCTIRHTTYHPNYSDISPSARAAYLDWLASGRQNAAADIGYVFIFFYGLERRILVDSKLDPSIRQEWPRMAAELRGLLGIYRTQSNSFKIYATALLELIELNAPTSKLYEKPINELSRTFELPIPIRIALGQAAVDNVPVPVHLALTWIKHAPEIQLGAAASRCIEEFNRCFALRYLHHFGDGLVLPVNRTPLRLAYRPASAALRGTADLRIEVGNLPDITAVTTPIQKLKEVVEQVTDELGPYSRYVKRNPGSELRLEGILQLPPALWPTPVQSAVDALKARIGNGMIVLSCSDLLKALNAEATLTRDQFLILAEALEDTLIGMEPDVIAGSKIPKPTDRIALFAMPETATAKRTSAAYKTAVLTLQLASTVANADGRFDGVELAYLSKQVKAWTHLSLNHQRRLTAQLRLLSQAPASLQAIKKRLEPLTRPERTRLAAFMTTVAQSGGTVTPGEVRTLQKIYAALGVENDAVFRDIHAAATGASPLPNASNDAFELDHARIAVLQRDTDQAAALLRGIFTDEEKDISVPAADAEISANAEQAQRSGLLGLDEAHSAFARLLLSHSEWTRAQLSDVAADLDLMLDGALERINDACFEAFNQPLTEGEDPVTVNSELLEKIAA
jgi:uncharacterized tellurite resistance protein B-like protein